ncbi:MAG: hypothetical protein Q8Q31_00405 [Nanoarchaeota archaeon]|nr:hypothetical protein [Nanoarchaeota archaeon]
MNLDLGLLTKKSFQALSARVNSIQPNARLTIDKRFEFTPDKGYSAKASTNVEESGGRPLGSGTATLIMFRQGDGTGNAQDYQIEGLEAKHTPRNKEGAAELYISIGTFFNGSWIPGITCLSCYGLDARGQILGYKGLGSSATGFEANLAAFKERKSPFPIFHYDFTFDRNPTYHEPNPIVPYGNPHAILWPHSLQIEHTGEFFQIGAFLPFPEETESLVRIRELVKS